MVKQRVAECRGIRPQKIVQRQKQRQFWIRCTRLSKSISFGGQTHVPLTASLITAITMAPCMISFRASSLASSIASGTLDTPSTFHRRPSPSTNPSSNLTYSVHSPAFSLFRRIPRCNSVRAPTGDRLSSSCCAAYTYSAASFGCSCNALPTQGKSHICYSIPTRTVQIYAPRVHAHPPVSRPQCTAPTTQHPP